MKRSLILYFGFVTTLVFGFAKPSVAQTASNRYFDVQGKVFVMGQEVSTENALKSLGWIRKGNSFTTVADAGYFISLVAGGFGVGEVILNRVIGTRITKLGRSSLIVGGYWFNLGVGATVIGVLVDVFWPSPAHAATMTEYYQTNEGFQVFLALPEEEQIRMLNMSPKLTTLVMAIGTAFQMEQTALVNGQQ